MCGFTSEGLTQNAPSKQSHRYTHRTTWSREGRSRLMYHRDGTEKENLLSLSWYSIMPMGHRLGWSSSCTQEQLLGRLPLPSDGAGGAKMRAASPKAAWAGGAWLELSR